MASAAQFAVNGQINISRVNISPAVLGRLKSSISSALSGSGKSLGGFVEKDLSNVQKTIKSLSPDVKKFGEATKKASIGASAGFKSVNDQQKNFSKTHKQLLTEFRRENIFAQLEWQATRLVGWYIVAGGIYKAKSAFDDAVKTAIEFEKEFTNVIKVMRITESQTRSLESSVLSFAKTYGFSIQEATKAAAVYAQQGRNVVEVTKLTEASLLLANVSILSTTQATEGLTAIMEQFGFAAEDTGRIIDSLNEVANKFAVTEADIVQAVSRAGAAAKASGVQFETFEGIVAALQQRTRRGGAVIGTALKTIFARLNTEKAINSLRNVGIATFDMSGEFRSAEDRLKEVSAKWDSLTSVQKNNVATALAGIRRYSDFINLMEGFDDALRAAEVASNAQGSAMTENEKIMDTMTKTIEAAGAAWDSFIVSLSKGGATDTLKLMASSFKAVSTALEAVPPGLITALIAGTAIAGIGAAGRIGAKAFRGYQQNRAALSPLGEYSPGIISLFSGEIALLGERLKDVNLSNKEWSDTAKKLVKARERQYEILSRVKAVGISAAISAGAGYARRQFEQGTAGEIGFKGLERGADVALMLSLLTKLPPHIAAIAAGLTLVGSVLYDVVGESFDFSKNVRNIDKDIAGLETKAASLQGSIARIKDFNEKAFSKDNIRKMSEEFEKIIDKYPEMNKYSDEFYKTLYKSGDAAKVLQKAIDSIKTEQLQKGFSKLLETVRAISKEEKTFKNITSGYGISQSFRNTPFGFFGAEIIKYFTSPKLYDQLFVEVNKGIKRSFSNVVLDFSFTGNTSEAKSQLLKIRQEVLSEINKSGLTLAQKGTLSAIVFNEYSKAFDKLNSSVKKDTLEISTNYAEVSANFAVAFSKLSLIEDKYQELRGIISAESEITGFENRIANIRLLDKQIKDITQILSGLGGERIAPLNLIKPFLEQVKSYSKSGEITDALSSSLAKEIVAASAGDYENKDLRLITGKILSNTIGNMFDGKKIGEIVERGGKAKESLERFLRESFNLSIDQAIRSISESNVVGATDERYVKAIEDIVKRTESLTKAQNKLAELSRSKVADVVKYIDSFGDSLDKIRNISLDLINSNNKIYSAEDDLFNIRSKSYSALDKAGKVLEDDTKRRINSQSIIDRFSSNITLSLEKRMEIVENRFKIGAISEEQYNNAILSLEQQRNSKVIELTRQRANIEQDSFSNLKNSYNEISSEIEKMAQARRSLFTTSVDKLARERITLETARAATGTTVESGDLQQLLKAFPTVEGREQLLSALERAATFGDKWAKETLGIIEKDSKLSDKQEQVATLMESVAYKLQSYAEKEARLVEDNYQKQLAIQKTFGDNVKKLMEEVKSMAGSAEVISSNLKNANLDLKVVLESNELIDKLRETINNQLSNLPSGSLVPTEEISISIADKLRNESRM